MELIDPFEIAPKLEGKYNQDMVRYAPKIDAEVVVKCAECEYSSYDGWYCTGCGLMPAHKTFPHEYCSHGNPKEDFNNG